MRIVMGCHDVDPIDRRIFHEAKSLREAGHEVILFAGEDPALPWVSVEDQLTVFRDWQHRGGKWSGFVRLFSRKLRDATWLPGRLALHYGLKQLRNLPHHVKNLLTGKPSVDAPPAQVESLSPEEATLVKRVEQLRPDCVVAHDLPMLRAMVVAGKACGAKIVYDSHECFPEIGFYSEAWQAYYRNLETRWIAEADLVYTVNPLLADHMASVYRRPVESITNAIDPPPTLRLHPRPNHFRRVLSLPSSTRILLYQGGFAPNRGLENLIEAMPHVDRSIHLVFLGYNDYKDTLALIARQQKVSDRVHIVPPRTQADLLEWTASADAGIIPYLLYDKHTWYVSPNKLFEYIAVELPFLSNDLPFLRQVVDDIQGGVVADLTTPTLCGEAINRFFENADDLQRMRRNLHARREDYLWKKQGEKLNRLFSAIGITQVQARAA